MKTALALLVFLCAFSPVPDSIAYQGYLEDGGIPVNNPSATLAFRLFDSASGGSQLWIETQSGIVVEGGLFSASLGRDVQ